ncbi:MAG: chemotaxis protein CheW [Nitrospira sp.]
MSLRGHRATSTSHAPTDRYLIATVGLLRCAIPAETVHGILTLEEGIVTGTLTVQGQQYPASDLAGRLGLVEKPAGPETRFVLLAYAGLQAYVRVDHVGGLVDVEQVNVLPLPPQFRREERSWYSGFILIGDDVAVGLQARWLVNQIRGNPLLIGQEGHGVRPMDQRLAC